MADDIRTDAPKGGEAPQQESAFIRQVMLFYGVGALFLALVCLLWFAANVLLLAFAAVLLAVLLGDAVVRVQKWLPLSRGQALGLVVLVTLTVLGLIGWLAAPGVAEQTNLLFDTLSRSIERLQASMQGYGFLQNLWGKLPSPEALATQASTMVTRAGVFFSGILGALASVVIVVFVGIYLAGRPDSYINGIVRMFPADKRSRTREIMHEIGHVLAQWLMGKMWSMVIIGSLTAIGLALLQVPLAMVLGILAGLLDFIPYIGPIMAGVPAVLIAFSESPTLALYVALLFVGLQMAEAYLLSPLIERRTVSLPPALTIMMQTLLGTFFGLAGIALATPLTAALAVMITMLYVQDVLGDQVKIPGEH